MSKASISSTTFSTLVVKHLCSLNAYVLFLLGLWELTGDVCLSCAGNRIRAKGLEHLLSALIPADGACTSKLEVLGLGRNALGDAGADVLADYLEPCLQDDGAWTYPYSLTSVNVWGEWTHEADGPFPTMCHASLNAACCCQEERGAVLTKSQMYLLAGNSITDQGALNLMGVFKPRKNKDGTVAYNKTVTHITMFRECL